MTAKNSLVGASIANRITEHHDPAMAGGPHIDRAGPHVVVYVHPTYDMRFIGRFCTVKNERSGGYVISGALNERYKHEAGFIQFIERRLKPGWKPVDLQRACHRIFLELSEIRTIRRHREQVYILAESKSLDLERVDAIAVAEGHTLVYADMTMANCEFWKVEMSKTI